MLDPETAARYLLALGTHGQLVHAWNALLTPGGKLDKMLASAGGPGAPRPTAVLDDRNNQRRPPPPTGVTATGPSSGDSHMSHLE